jgi:hypothetical protein
MKKTLYHFIVLSCKRASFLIEKQQDKPLSVIDKTQLNLHLKICSECSRYQKQSLIIDNVLKSNHQTNLEEFKLSDGVKDRLQKALDEEMKK